MKLRSHAFRGLAPLAFAASAAAQGFGPPQPIALLSKDVADLDIADMNGDGLNDVVVSASTGFFGGGLYVFLASAPGVFPDSPELVFGDVCGTEIADLDGDGDLDVVTNWDGFICPQVVWFENDGSGQSFTLRNLIKCSNAANTCAALEVFDQDSDGDLDIALVALGGVVFLKQITPGDFALEEPVAGFGLQPGSLAAGNFDMDGQTELFAARKTPGGAFSEESWELRTLDQDGGGVWQAAASTALESAASQVLWEGIGGTDALVVHDSLREEVVLVDHPLSATPQTVTLWFPATGEVAALATGDLDGDGDQDLLLPWSERGELLWLPNLGMTEAPPALYVAENLTGLGVATTGDVNADGLDDVLIAVQEDVGQWRVMSLTNFGQPDCNGNGQDDYLDVLQGLEEDCNGNGFLDVCEVLDPGADVNGSGVPDDCELALTSVSPDGGPWHTANTLTLSGTFDPGLPLQVQIGSGSLFEAQVLDADSAQLQLAPSAVSEVGSLAVTVLQGGLQESLPFAWAPTPALVTETTGTLAGGGRVQFFLRNELPGIAWYALDFDLSPASVPFVGIHHLLELHPTSLAVLGSNAIAAQPEGGAAPSFEVPFPAGIAPFSVSFRTQVLVSELDGLTAYPAFTNTRTNTIL